MDDDVVVVPEPPTPDPSPVQDQLIPDTVPEEPTPKSTPRTTPEPPTFGRWVSSGPQFRGLTSTAAPW